MFQFVEVIRRVADVVMGVAALGAAVQQAQIRQRRRGRLGRDLSGIDQVTSLPMKSPIIFFNSG